MDTTNASPAQQPLLQRIWSMYYDGFKSMTVGKQLWALIIVKAILFFLVIKLFFFPDILHVNYSTDADRAAAVRTQLTK